MVKIAAFHKCNMAGAAHGCVNVLVKADRRRILSLPADGDICCQKAGYSNANANHGHGLGVV